MEGHSKLASELTPLIIELIEKTLENCQQPQASYENTIIPQLDKLPLTSNSVNGQKTGGHLVLPSEQHPFLITLRKWLREFQQLQSQNEAPLHSSTSGPHNPNTIQMEKKHEQNQEEFFLEVMDSYDPRLGQYLVESWLQRNGGEFNTVE
ncbi:hypothetical protein Forpe1208_v017115 [Fusarium oxysporum f. sp. rapae]|uniref:Uncharacterized protein n=1 Tax=Fusarium oxysporum f. sp. rapae TaxID=485398 RepID=A0A8J5TLP4_FUSOX|nr:hypothetical protein Forpe1208_v017115 [Fusarium oxysporum f. sp. rapae]